MSMHLYEVVLYGKDIDCDEHKTYFRSRSSVRAFIKEKMPTKQVDKVTVNVVYYLFRIARIDMLNRRGFLSNRELFSITKEEWEEKSDGGLDSVSWAVIKMKKEKIKNESRKNRRRGFNGSCQIR